MRDLKPVGLEKTYAPLNFLGGLARSPASGWTTHLSSTSLQRRAEENLLCNHPINLRITCLEHGALHSTDCTLMLVSQLHANTQSQISHYYWNQSFEYEDQQTDWPQCRKIIIFITLERVQDPEWCRASVFPAHVQFSLMFSLHGDKLTTTFFPVRTNHTNKTSTQWV